MSMSGFRKIKMNTLKLIAPILITGLGLYGLRRSLHEFALWRAELLVDPSNAEFYEISFWIWVVPSVLLLLLAGFLAGRFWRK
jgi:hypothetical protein